MFNANREKSARVQMASTFIAALLAGSAMGAAAAAPLATFDVQEHLGRDWKAELIHYDGTFAPGECLSTSVHVRDDSGRELAAQMSGVTQHADGSIQRAEVWFLVSLSPHEARRFTLQPGKPAAADDLTLVRKNDVLEVSNGLVGARFHLGERQFSTPIPTHEVPAFLAAVQLRGGAWTGRGWFETPKKCGSYKVALIESGPVFARIAFEYRFDGFCGEGGEGRQHLSWHGANHGGPGNHLRDRGVFAG